MLIQHPKCGHLYLSGVWLGVDLRMDTTKEIGVSAQNMLNHSRLNSQHNWGGLYDHSMSMRIFTVIVKMIFI